MDETSCIHPILCTSIHLWQYYPTLRYFRIITGKIVYKMSHYYLSKLAICEKLLQMKPMLDLVMPNKVITPNCNPVAKPTFLLPT